MVPRAIQHVFDIIEKTPGRDFLLRMSMMEIYNEVRSRALYSFRQTWVIIADQCCIHADHAMMFLPKFLCLRPLQASLITASLYSGSGCLMFPAVRC